MSKLPGYSDVDKKRIAALAARFVEGMIRSGEIPCTDEAIKAAMPRAVEDARAVVTAANEFIS